MARKFAGLTAKMKEDLLSQYADGLETIPASGSPRRSLALLPSLTLAYELETVRRRFADAVFQRQFVNFQINGLRTAGLVYQADPDNTRFYDVLIPESAHTDDEKRKHGSLDIDLFSAPIERALRQPSLMQEFFDGIRADYEATGAVESANLALSSIAAHTRFSVAQLILNIERVHGCGSEGADVASDEAGRREYLERAVKVINETLRAGETGMLFVPPQISRTMAGRYFTDEPEMDVAIEDACAERLPDVEVTILEPSFFKDAWANDGRFP